jgi:hypothetical protein
MTRNDEQGGVSVRLVRLERQQSRVADDVRAALASLGRGSTVIGGIALVGVGSVTERPIEAVVLLPHGVIIVIGVDLPDPALRLEAPLGAEWKADGWPLVADDDAINPATEALDISQACEQRIAALVPGTAPVGTIVAVGPYVETVDQPAGDLAGPVRVLHPTPTTMLAATVSLATAHRPRSVDQVRALIRGLAPEAPAFSDEVLLGEGFSRFTDDSPPESLWDTPAAPARAAGSGGGATDAGSAAEDSTAADEAVESPAATGSAAADSAAPGSAAAADPATPDSIAAGSTTAQSADTAVASSAAADSVESEPATGADSEPSPEAQPSETAPEPDLPSAAETTPPHDDTELPSPLAESERTEVLPSPAAEEETEPDRPAEATVLPLFPGAESPPPPRFPGPAQAGADTERTETLDLPDTERTENLGHPDTERTETLPAEPGRATSQPTDPGRAAAEPGPYSAATRPAEPEPTEPEPAEPKAAVPVGVAHQPAAGSARPFPTPRPVPRPSPPAPLPAARASRTVRWLPLGAVGLLVALVVAAVAIATTGDGTAAAPAGPPASPSRPPAASGSAAPVQSLQFALRAADGDQRCASHAFGDAQASLQQTSCSGVRRASYAATIDGRAGAITVGIVAFPDAAQAAAFKAVADTPGGGGILDLATETGKWGATAPQFENAAYASKVDGTSVRLVQAVWTPGPSTSDDPGLARAAKAALDLPAQ